MYPDGGRREKVPRRGNKHLQCWSRLIGSFICRVSFCHLYPPFWRHCPLISYLFLLQIPVSDRSSSRYCRYNRDHRAHILVLSPDEKTAHRRCTSKVCTIHAHVPPQGPDIPGGLPCSTCPNPNGLVITVPPCLFSHLIFKNIHCVSWCSNHPYLIISL